MQDNNRWWESDTSGSQIVMTSLQPSNITELLTSGSPINLVFGANGSQNNMNETITVNTNRIAVSIIWGLITFVGAVGNIIVIFTMCRHGGRTMPRSATNCYIINVALADLAFLLFVIPVTTSVYVTEHWDYGDVVCKINSYIIFVTLLSTCLTLTAMTIDRYFAIVHPIRSLRRRTPKSTFIICVAIWIASMVVSSPYLQFQEVGVMFNTTVCHTMWPPGWDKASIIIIVFVTYVIPLTVIVVSYTLILKFLWRHRIGVGRECNHNSDSSEPVMGGENTIARRRKKVAKMVAAVVILFAIAWLPIHLFNLCFALMEDRFPRNQIMYDLKVFAHTLSYTNSCVNPFVYTIMGDSFRKAFRESLPICRGSSSNFQRPRKTQESTGETRFNGD